MRIRLLRTRKVMIHLPFHTQKVLNSENIKTGKKRKQNLCGALSF